MFHNWNTVTHNTNSTFIMFNFVLENKDYNAYFVRILGLKLYYKNIVVSLSKGKTWNIESTFIYSLYIPVWENFLS